MKASMYLAVLVNAAVMTSAILSAAATAGETKAQDRRPDAAVCTPDDLQASQFRPGDRITVTMYERVEPDENDRYPSKNTYPNYRLRPEVSGDFNVGEDGTISVPVLGQFQTAGKSVDEIRDALSQRFDTLLGRAGVITIALAERQPIYIDGVVKNPGAYKYTPGITVFHALSLAGGYENIKLESHQVLLATAQEAVSGEQTKENLKRLLAREAVLRAELESTPVSTPQALLDIADESQAKALIAAQARELQTVIGTNNLLEQQQAQLIDSANVALEVRTNEMKLIDAAIEQRDQRLKNLTSMKSQGFVGDALLQGAKADYLDTLARKQDLVAAQEQSHTQLVGARSTMAKIKLDTQFALQREISDLQLQIAQQWTAYRSHLAVNRIVDTDPNLSSGTPMEFDLVRRIGDHVASTAVQGSCLLQPGDLVRVHEARPKPQ